MRLLKSFMLPVVLGLVAGLSACSSGPTIRADADPSANLSAYKTFGFFDQVSTDKMNYGTIASQRLKQATRNELTRRGYAYSDSGPQLLVNFNINLENRSDVRSEPGVGVGYGGYYGYRAGMYGVWGGYPQNVETVHYQVGTLTIDMVDSARKQLVWQGTAQGRVDKQAVENPGPAIDKAVADIFEKFPVPAAGVPAQ